MISELIAFFSSPTMSRLLGSQMAGINYGRSIEVGQVMITSHEAIREVAREIASEIIGLERLLPTVTNKRQIIRIKNALVFYKKHAMSWVSLVACSDTLPPHQVDTLM